MNRICRIFLAILFSLMLAAMFNGRATAAEPSTDRWTKTYGGTNSEEVYALVQTGDGGYALAGGTNSFGVGGYDFWLVKTDADGVVPEFPSSMILVAFMATVTLTAVLTRRKHRVRLTQFLASFLSKKRFFSTRANRKVLG